MVFVLDLIAPPAIAPPLPLHSVSDSSIKLRLYRASAINGPISHYYVFVATTMAAAGRPTDSYRVEEVRTALLSIVTVAIAIVVERHLVSIFMCDSCPRTRQVTRVCG